MFRRPDLHTDCRQFRWDRPCDPHKQTGVRCPECTVYDPIRSRVLVVKLAATGDVLRTTALLPAIHSRFPGARVTWLTARAAVPLFVGNRLVDEVLSSDASLTTARLQVETFDAILCPDSDPDAATLAAAAKGRQRFGFSLDQDGHVQPLGSAAEHWLRMGLSDADKKRNRETYQALVARVLELDPAEVRLPILEPQDEDRRAAEILRRSWNGPQALIGLNTGAGGRWTYKQWTLEHQQTFLRLCARHGFGVVLLGGPKERARHETLLRSAPGLPVFDAGTDNSYHRFAAIVDLCAAVVTGDTFALHVACARKKPVIALFGPTSSSEVELYGRGEKLLPPDLDCVCCYLPICDVKPHCQARILPERVLEAVRRWVGR
jgi:heptosyltransferase-2